MIWIKSHPDRAGHHLLHAMVDAYAERATVAGHEVRRIKVAKSWPAARRFAAAMAKCML